MPAINVVPWVAEQLKGSAYYRNRLTKELGAEVGSIVGAGLDAIERGFWQSEIEHALAHYEDHREAWEAQGFSQAVKIAAIANLFLEPGQKPRALVSQPAPRQAARPAA